MRLSLGFVLTLLLAGVALAARDKTAECAAGKLALAGGFANCRIAAQAVAVRKGRTPKLAVCDARLAAKFARLEKKLGAACPTQGDLGALRAAAQRFTDDLTASAQGTLHCSEDPTRLELDGTPSHVVPTGTQRLENNVLQVAEGIYMVPGFGNTYLVVTPAGNVVIDTSLSLFAPTHVEALRAVSPGSVRYIILTHGHPDHTGGVSLWKEDGSQVIAQSAQTELLNYQTRLDGVLNHRAGAQFSTLLNLPKVPFKAPDAAVVDYGATQLATTTFDTFCEFRLGGLTFQLVHTPGETYDHLSVWIPEYRIAFTGDNIYGSFPNLYTLRGTKPRWALDYVESLDRVRSWRPEILAPSHETPTYGNAAIELKMKRYRDAILYVHDETVRGMNAGRDVFSLMRTVDLPPELAVGEGYGTVAWSVRGIYEGYLGWFDENPATMYAVPPQTVYPELVTLAGGVGPILTRAAALEAGGRHAEAIRLTDVVLAVEPANVTALQTRLAAVTSLAAASGNINERGWLNAAKKDLEAQLGP